MSMLDCTDIDIDATCPFAIDTSVLFGYPAIELFTQI